jgi:hypothetical protein
MSNPAPPGWNKTLKDLFEEVKQGKRRGINYDERCWAVDYERSFFPPDIIFPRIGQILESISECDVIVRYVFAAPASQSGSGRLAIGERVRIGAGGREPKPIFVNFQPLRYDDLHASLVPAEVRSEVVYTSYVLSTKTVYFNEHFRLIEDVA